MKSFTVPVLAIMILLSASGCGGRGSSEKSKISQADTVSVPDTGYTGIKKYLRANRLIKEVTFKNGVRQGEMKTFYPGGQLYQTFWYENGLREDSSRWYYLEGQVFRSTPYLNDTIDGIQKQYYRTGRLKAKIGYSKGFRTPYIEEYTTEGRVVAGYPDIVFSFADSYNTTGKFRINLELSNKNAKVKFYRGEFANGVFDTAACIKINTLNGKAFIDLKKTGSPQRDYVGVIGECITGFGNKYLIYKKVDLPYKDLK